MFPPEVNMLAYAFLVLAVAMRFLPHTFHPLPGASACYMAAITFIERTFASDMIYSMAIFAAPLAVAAIRQPPRGHIQSLEIFFRKRRGFGSVLSCFGKKQRKGIRRGGNAG